MTPDVPVPPVARLPGGRIHDVDAAAGTLRSNYVATGAFLNPAGQVQDGMLCAMLDDLTASLVTAMLASGESCATLNLGVSFLRPATRGALTGTARFMRRGRQVCHVAGELAQDGRVVATGNATCMVVRRP
jgi:uncharacterized protein (TIGR00369 family)